jgi:hypothetical protein
MEKQPLQSSIVAGKILAIETIDLRPTVDPPLFQS